MSFAKAKKYTYPVSRVTFVGDGEMPLQEGLVLDGNYGVPCGVFFPRGYAARSEDGKTWRQALKRARQEAAAGRVIGVLVQTRSARAWNEDRRNFDFDLDEDILVAVYSLSRAYCSPFDPGSLLQHWADDVLGGVVDLNRSSMFGDDTPFPLFYCSSGGCKLTKVGLMTVMTAFRRQNDRLGDVEAFTEAKAAMFGPQYGWHGGFFDPDDAAGAGIGADAGDPFADFDRAFGVMPGATSTS